MHCDILQRLYIRANGEVPCYDDAGERIALGDLRTDSITAILANDRYAHLRESLRGGRMPWPETCAHCALLRSEQPLSDDIAARRILTLQVEPSLPCNLRCPCCTNRVQMKTRTGPRALDPGVFETALRDLAAAGYDVREIEYAGQGEPIMHPRFAEVVRISRRVFPRARQRLITNGTLDYWKATEGEAIDEIVVSCDGYHQESYEKYRVGGRVSGPLAFLRSAPARIAGIDQRRTWKYILLEFNDSDEEIAAAQHAAQELGIDLLFFVLTHSMFRSRRFTARTISRLPILFPNVTTTSTPHMLNDWVDTHPLADPVPTATVFKYAVDVCRMRAGRFLRISGWALAAAPVTAIHVAVDGRGLGLAECAQWRPDVQVAFPDYVNPSSGFEFLGDAGDLAPGPHSVTLSCRSGDVVAGTIEATVEIPHRGRVIPIRQSPEVAAG